MSLGCCETSAAKHPSEFCCDFPALEWRLQRMLPNSHHAPVKRTQFARAAAVAVAICQHFCFPVGPIIVGQPITPRATVPEAAVNENCHSLRPESEIRLAGKTKMSAPSRNLGAAQEPHERPFSCCVTLRTDTRHVARALLLREPVRHGPLYFGPSGLIFPYFCSNQLRRWT